MPRGRRPKDSVKPPTTVERAERLQQGILNLNDELMADGFGNFLQPPGPVKFIAPPITDGKTGGLVGHVQEPLGSYIQRVSVEDNFMQRPPFDHATDPVYKRLIKDFISGAAMPEAKVAALSRTEVNKKATSLDESNIYFSIIDGLQRLYCFCIALLLVLRRERLVRDACITNESWLYFQEAVAKTADSRAATEELLQRVVRYEIFYQIDLAGLLHYMVTFNTGQRRMSLPVQLEIMRKPLVEELENRAKVPVWHEMAKMPGITRPKDKFAASELALTVQAFITNNAQLSANAETERFLNESQAYLDNVGEIDDVVHVLKRIGTEIHPEIMRIYAGDSSRRFILSAGGTFLLSLAAACGYVRNRGNMKMLDGALDRLRDELKKRKDDPLKLDDYYKALSTITSSRGKSMRRLVYDTFLRFFYGSTAELEWLDTVAQITGVMP